MRTYFFMSVCSVLTCFGLYAKEKVVLKIASIAPARSIWETELKKLSAEWSEITGGLVSMKFYDMSSLGGEREGIRKLKSSRPGQAALLDGAVFSCLGLSELAPDSGIYTLSVPFLIQNEKDLERVLHELREDLDRPFRAAGFRVITWTNAGWLSFYTRAPYASLGQLKKQTIALSSLDSSVLGTCFRICGFDIKDAPNARLAPLLKAGSIDGFLSVHLFTWATGFYRYISYALDTKICPAVIGMLISDGSWARIPSRYHDAMLQAATRVRQRLANNLETLDRECSNNIQKAGVSIVHLTPQEIQEWRTEFAADVKRIQARLPGMLNMTLYEKIKHLLYSAQR